MIAEIILIPDGLGLDAAKAGAQYVARGLSSIGLKVREQISVCPDKAQFQQAVAAALTRSNVLVTLGGMGPESNYLAKTVLSRGLGLPLEENAAALTGLREYCRRNAETFGDEDFALVMLPRGSTAFSGSYGKLPGCAISSSKQHIIMLPETQAEIAPMFNKYISPYLGGSASTTVTRVIRTYGMSEDEVTQALGDVLNRANPAVTTQKDENEVLVRVSAHATNSKQAAALCTPTLQDVVDRLGDSAYGLDVDSMQAAVIAKLQKKELDLAIAEGGTGGMLTRVISETPGGQDVLRYTISVDTPEIKEQKLGIDRKELKKHGNISEYAAVAAANAAREKSGTAIGVCVLANTGEEKSKACPPGVVYIAVCTANHVYAKKLVVGEGNADADVIVDAALSRALNMTRLTLDYLPGPYTSAIPLSEALAGHSVTDLDDYEDFDVPEEKASSGGGFFGNFIMRKSDSRGVKVRKFILILATLIFLGSAGYVGLHYYNGYVAKKQAAELANMFEFGDMGDVEVSPDYPKDYSLRFAGLWNINPDVVAFISIPDTGVKYPIVQADDNDYYMRRDFYGGSNRYGIPFMDYRVNMKKPSDNIVIYGHNMMDGQIFGELISYKNLDYYKEHPLVNCFTVYDDMADESTVYKIFSVFITNAYENQGSVFEYHNFIDAETAAEFTDFVNEVTNRSLINTTVDVRKGDKLLTLSTCSYEFQDARLVVVARALRKGESEEVNVEEAITNPAPLMPDVWYKTFGGSRPSDEELAVQPTAADPSGILYSITPLVSRTASDAALADEAEARAESRREQSKLDEESRLEAMSKAVSDAAASIAESEAAASKAAEEKAASEAAASKAESEAAASKAAAEAAASKAASEAAASKAAAEAERQAEEEAESEEPEGDEKASSKVRKSDMDTTVSVSYGGKVYRNVDEMDVVPRIVQTEVGSAFHIEAIKAQAVAAYTFIRNANASGSIPGVIMSSSANQKVVDAVAEVLGEAVYYKDRPAFTPYHAISAGLTTSSKDVWGGSYPYLVEVNSEVDKEAPYYRVKVSMTRSKVAGLIKDKLGISASGDPSGWFEILSYADGGYNGAMSVCGETKSKITGSKITGRLLRESVFSLRSACFEIDYDSGNETFYFTTYGYGHGVGMSQTGANLYAKQGWNYIDILEHYYQGTTVM